RSANSGLLGDGSVRILGYTLPLEPLLGTPPVPVPAVDAWHVVGVVREPQVLRAIVKRVYLRRRAVGGVAHPGGKHVAPRADANAVVMRPVVLQVDLRADQRPAVDEVGNPPGIVFERVAVNLA